MSPPRSRSLESKLFRERSPNWLILALLVFDPLFKAATVPAFLVLSGIEDHSQRVALVLRALALTVVLRGSYLVGTWDELRPIVRWRKADSAGTATDAMLVQASNAIHRLPLTSAFKSAVLYTAFYALLAHGVPNLDPSVFALFLVMTVLAPLPFGHALTIAFLAPTVRRLADVARTRGITLSIPAASIRARLAFYSVCIAIVPTAYMSALVLREHGRDPKLVVTIAIFMAGTLVFTLLSAILVSVGLTKPMRLMSRVMRAVAREGDVVRVGRVPIFQRDELGQLGRLTNVMLDRLEATRRERTAAAESLAQLNQSLEARVTSRTAELVSRTDDMRLVLDNVGQGLFTVDRHGVVSAERSAILAAWFGELAVGETIAQYLGRVAPALADDVACAWEQVAEDFLPIAVTLDAMPKTLTRGDRHYRLTYSPIGGDAWTRLLVVVSDVTMEVEGAAAQRERREIYALFEHALSDRVLLADFLDEGAAVVARLDAGDHGGMGGDDDLASLKRDIHTLKGSGLLFGLESIAALCHDIETALAEGRTPSRALFAKLCDRWYAIDGQVGRVLGKTRNTIELSQADYLALEDAASDTSRDRIVRLLRELKLEPVEVRLRHFAEQARRIGDRLEKPITATVETDGLRLDARAWSRFWSAFVHAVRNAVDHGIEDAARRADAGKPAAGRIVLRARYLEGAVVIEIEDDGSGIDWEAVRASAAKKGIVATTREQLVAALFTDGLSTASTISELSGRGVGMGALGAEVTALGGRIDIDSTPGAGTRLRMTFFADSTVAPPSKRAPRRSLPPLRPSRAPSRAA